MNIDPLMDTVVEQARKIYFLPNDDLKIRISKLKDPKLVKELWTMAFQKDRNDIKKLLEEKAKELNVTLL